MIWNELRTALRFRIRGQLVDRILQKMNDELALRSKAEADLQLSEAKFRGVLVASPDGVMIVGKTGLIDFASDRVTDIFGYLPDELCGKPIEILIPERFRGPHSDDVGGYFHKPKTRMMGDGLTLFGRRKDGTEFPVEISLSPIAFSGVDAAIVAVRDVTSRKVLEALHQKEAQALRESEERLRFFVKYSPAAIAMLDKEMRYLVASDRWLADNGLVGRDLRGLSHYFVFPDMPDRWRLVHRRALAGETVESEEDSLAKPDGGIQWLKWGARPWRDAMGNIGGIVLLTEDITDRKRMEAQLQQSQKMDAIGQLTGGVAHDFNNILTVITGTIGILADAVTDRPDLSSIARLIDDAAERGARLTKHLLAFARKQPLQPREIDVNALVLEAAKLLHLTLGEQIAITTQLSDDAWTALVDPNQLTTSILNLALNARDAMPGGGTLVIETRNVYLDEGYASMNSDVRVGNYVMIAVSDTGTGIPTHLLERVFDPFFTTKEVGKGTGLGLSMVFGFVKQSEGHIKIYSEEGHGTSVKMYLPRAAGMQDIAVEAAPPSTIEGGDEVVLIVEDDALVRRYVVTQIASLGYTPLEAANATEALQVIDSGAPVDLLFTDVIIPGPMNGRQLVDEALKRRPSLKTLFTSGYTENAIVHHGRLDPGVNLLQKPYRSDELARKVREVLDS
jgi:PAS domain S-box-containing protein